MSQIGCDVVGWELRTQGGRALFRIEGQGGRAARDAVLHYIAQPDA